MDPSGGQGARVVATTAQTDLRLGLRGLIRTTGHGEAGWCPGGLRWCRSVGGHRDETYWPDHDNNRALATRVNTTPRDLRLWGRWPTGQTLGSGPGRDDGRLAEEA